MDPQLTSDGKPFGPIKYEKIVQERFLISKFLNTSYTDCGNISPREREALIKLIIDDIKRQNEQIQNLKNNKR